MKIKFLGGAEEVGRLGMVLETEGGRVLFDYGLTPSDPPKYPQPATNIDVTFLTHGHTDHSGMIPWLCRRNSGMPVQSTSMTRELSTLLAYDNIKVNNYEGYPSQYNAEDVKRAHIQYDEIEFGETNEFGGAKIKYHSAGHIPGATMFEVDDGRKLLFTGDINTIDARLVAGAKPVKCDILAIETTYSGREHPGRPDTERAFLNKVEDVVDRGGLAVVPAFAVGRTQEMLMLLSGEGYDVWLDGMGLKVTYMMLDDPNYISSPKKLRKALSEARFARGEVGRRQALKADVIVTTSGMLDGGPALRYINRIKDHEESAILLTGYQVEGTNGRLLLDKKMLDFSGSRQKVNCEVAFFDFSSHAGHGELLKFIDGCSPEEVILYHGDNRIPIADAIRSRYKVHMPFAGETLEF